MKGKEINLILEINKNFRKLYQVTSNFSIRLIEKAKMTEHLFMIIMAIIIGILAGLGAVGIRALIKFISDISFFGEGSLLDRIIAIPWYYKIIIPAVGGFIVGPIIYFFAPEAKGHGVPEVMQAVLVKGGRIRPRVAFIKALASSITIGTGGSVGREGPIIQIGSSLGSTVGQFFRVPTKRLKTLVGCGAAAGIAAAFNAPIAGALFAVEIILMDFAVAQFSPIVISAVIATVISHYFEGDFAAFVVHSYHLATPFEIFFYFILGALTGVVAYLFIKILYFSEDIWDNKIKIPEYLKAGIGGIIFGTIAIFFPEVMGVGYDTINLALNGQLFLTLALVLTFIKIIATSITLGSGGSGGIFAPSLFIGATIGVAFGMFINQFFPDITADPGGYALVAMGGLVAGTTRAPITAILIVFELTQDYSIILPLMVTCIISMIVSSKLSRESIYTLKLILRNINVKEHAEVNILKSILVKDVYKADFISVPEYKTFKEIVEILLSLKVPYVTVVDCNGKLMGMISINNIKEIIFETESLKNVCIAGDVCDHQVPKVYLDDDCKNVLEKMDESGLDGLPVVSTEEPDYQIGMIWRKDIDRAYRKEVEFIDLTSDLAEKISIANLQKDVRFMEGYVITELHIPKLFEGKSIRELNIRNDFGVEIISIKSIGADNKNVTIIPQSDYEFQSGDHIIVAGRSDDINKLKNL